MSRSLRRDDATPLDRFHQPAHRLLAHRNDLDAVRLPELDEPLEHVGRLEFLDHGGDPLPHHPGQPGGSPFPAAEMGQYEDRPYAGAECIVDVVVALDREAAIDSRGREIRKPKRLNPVSAVAPDATSDRGVDLLRGQVGGDASNMAGELLGLARHQPWAQPSGQPIGQLGQNWQRQSSVGHRGSLERTQ